MEVQTKLRGVWTSLYGCPHYHGDPDSVGKCDAEHMAPCYYETYHENPEGCEIFLEVLEELKEEKENVD